MANPNELNPNIHNVDPELNGPRVPDDKIYRLMRRLPVANGPATSELVEPESKARRAIASPRRGHRLNRRAPLRRPVP